MRFMEGAFIMPVGSAPTAGAPWPEIWRDNSRTVPAYAAMASTPVTCAELAAIDAPTLILQGVETHVDTAMMADQVAGCLGSAFTIRVPDANHGIPMRTPEHIAQIISGFLDMAN